MLTKFKKIMDGQRVLILGMGREGQSSLQLITKNCHPSGLALADKNEKLLEKYASKYTCFFGAAYLDKIDDYDLIISSPGIPDSLLENRVDKQKLRSQTDIFLELFGNQTIGITGTKGKSTTSSLIYHIAKSANRPGLLVGNIGLPAFDSIKNIQPDTIIVYELSSHQLKNVRHSPHIAIVLNLFEEHLDHYSHVMKYYDAKLQIAKHQFQNDLLIYNGDNKILEELCSSASIRPNKIKYTRNKKADSSCYLSEDEKIFISFAKYTNTLNIGMRKSLPGIHNAMNAMAASLACLHLDIPENIIEKGIQSFTGLPHRMEFVGKYGGIRFYDDSISTIPQASIAAIKNLVDVDTLIIGGQDRGIDYTSLIEFLPSSPVKNIFYMGDAGKRIYGLLRDITANGQKMVEVLRFNDLEGLIRKYTRPGKICLLSPAAPSYDWFSNFSDRGEAFKKIARNL